jgi:hypothetical protein
VVAVEEQAGVGSSKKFPHRRCRRKRSYKCVPITSLVRSREASPGAFLSLRVANI